MVYKQAYPIELYPYCFQKKCMGAETGLQLQDLSVPDKGSMVDDTF